MPDLTIFTIPKPFAGDDAVRQINAIESWRRLPGVEVLLLGWEGGGPEVDRDEFGTPLLPSVLRTAEKHSRTPRLALVNADIMLTGAFVRAVASIPQADFVMVGGRVDINLRDPWSFVGGWEKRLEEFARRGEEHPPSGSDYFVYPRGFWRHVPEFSIGRPYYDNWLMAETRKRGAPLIDATDVVLAAHQRHDYRHVPGGDAAYWKGIQTARHRLLLGGLMNLYTLEDSTHRLTREGLCLNPREKNRPAERRALAARHPNWEKTVC